MAKPEDSKAFWVMMSGELGCSQCRKWKRVTSEMPCDTYETLDDMDVEMGCPYKEIVQ
jgi:hypothetical protein